MEYRIEKVVALTLGTTETEQELNCAGFLLENCSAENTVYFKEKAYDGVAVTSSNGFALGADKMMNVVLCGRTLSLIASDANTAVRLLLLEVA